jgi:hypothetical protein
VIQSTGKRLSKAARTQKAPIEPGKVLWVLCFLPDAFFATSYIPL